MEKSAVRWPISANLPTQKPALVLPLIALSQHNDFLRCEATTQQIPHRTQNTHPILLCRGFLCRNIVVLSYSTHNTTICCVVADNSQRNKLLYRQNRKPIRNGSLIDTVIRRENIDRWLMLMRRNVAAGIGSNEQGEYCRAALQRSGSQRAAI